MANSDKVCLLRPKAEIEGYLKSQVSEGDNIISLCGKVNLSELEQKYTTWHEQNLRILKNMYSTEEVMIEYRSSYVKKTPDPYSPFNRLKRDDDALRDFLEKISDKIRALRSIIEQLQYYADVVAPIKGNNISPKENSNEVFIVHGHNETIKEKVARTIEKLGLNPIILHEQVNGGSATIIEKFEKIASQASFAVVLFTNDDFGCAKTQIDAEGKPILTGRARQNVIFELGYFVGKLGRSRVVCLYEAGVEIQSDIQGVIYQPIDEGGAWKYKLVEEFKNAGYTVNKDMLPS